jgi:methionyl-tRNA formyltransferase
MPWRVVIATRIFPVAVGFQEAIRAAGHEPVALLTIRDLEGLYLGGALHELPGELDLLVPARRRSIAPLLTAVRPDLVVCMGFPWKIPPDALAVPPLGWLNGHPSLLPAHRGPIPVSWAIRNGDPEIGISFHFMDADLDTGPVVAQSSIDVGGYCEPEELFARMGPATGATLVEALTRIEAGDRGTPQPAGGAYESFFIADDVWLDTARSAEEQHRLAWAWRFAPPVGTEAGLLVELDGEPARIVRSSLEPFDGAVRIDCVDAPLWVTTEPLQARGGEPSNP